MSAKSFNVVFHFDIQIMPSFVILIDLRITNILWPKRLHDMVKSNIIANVMSEYYAKIIYD